MGNKLPCCEQKKNNNDKQNSQLLVSIQKPNINQMQFYSHQMSTKKNYNVSRDYEGRNFASSSGKKKIDKTVTTQTGKFELKRDFKSINETYQLKLSSYKEIKVLGSGANGTVKLVQEKKDLNKKKYALKLFDKKRLQAPNHIEIQQLLMLEKEILQNNQNAFVVNYQFSFQSDTYLCLGMEYVEGGNLFGLMVKSYEMFNVRGFQFEVVRFIAAEVVLALEYLHLQRLIMYRDIKPENILVTLAGHIKIADFGLSQQMKRLDDRDYNCYGTVQYMPPEMLNENQLKRGYTRSIDFWGIGILIFQLTTGICPFNGKNKDEIYKIMAKMHFKPVYPQEFPLPSQKIIDQFLNYDPQKRLGMGLNGFQEIYEHQFFQGINWNQIRNQTLRSPLLEILQAEESKFDKTGGVPETLQQSNLMESYQINVDGWDPHRFSSPVQSPFNNIDNFQNSHEFTERVFGTNENQFTTDRANAFIDNHRSNLLRDRTTEQ